MKHDREISGIPEENHIYVGKTHWIMIYGYIRGSSDKQTVENQRFEINNFCRRQDLKIGKLKKDKIFLEKRKK